MPAILAEVAVLCSKLDQNQAIPDRLCIGADAWLILNDHDRSGGVFDKQGQEARSQSGPGQGPLHQRRDILDLGTPP
jgi:hypothetical protein